MSFPDNFLNSTLVGLIISICPFPFNFFKRNFVAFIPIYSKLMNSEIIIYKYFNKMEYLLPHFVFSYLARWQIFTVTSGKNKLIINKIELKVIVIY